MDPIRIVIADDEPPARAKVRRFLASDPQVAIVAEAGSGPETIAAVERTRPDLLFLDVQMPEPDGFGVLAALDQAALPYVVFTTAYDEYAVRAFEVHAVDYLLKPFDEERFRTALRRAEAQIRRDRQEGEHGRGNDHRQGDERGPELGSSAPTQDWPDRLQRLLEELHPRGRTLDRVLVRRDNAATLLRTHEITWIEATGNYSRIHTAGDSYLIRGTLSSF